MWNDISTYSRGDTERVPSVFEIRLAPLRLIVLNSHIDHKGKWVMKCEGFVSLMPLHATNLEDAQKEAMEFIQRQIDDIQDAINLSKSK